MEGGRKIPEYFRLKSLRPFGFAGLYETWAPPGKEPLQTCVIITTEPNDLIRPIHNRMPVIVPKEKESLWLDPSVQEERFLSPILQPYPSTEMEIAPPPISGDIFHQ
jgi:putative SOS response-associated peptidase YedK